MDNLQLASIVGGGLITLFSFSFGIFWKLLKNTEESINKRIDGLVSSYGQLTEKARLDYVDITFVRKDVHTLEYMNLFREIRSVDEKLDKFIVNYQNK